MLHMYDIKYISLYIKGQKWAFMSFYSVLSPVHILTRLGFSLKPTMVKGE